jgi:bis(5'-adenosyl)-triphosphatase
MTTPLFFSTFEVTRQVFHRTALAYAIVNLKPIVPGRTSARPPAPRPRLSYLPTTTTATRGDKLN